MTRAGAAWKKVRQYLPVLTVKGISLKLKVKYTPVYTVKLGQ